MSERDETLELLQRMAITSPSPDFKDRLMAQARQTPQGHLGQFNPFRHLRASLLLPEIRRTVALSVIGGAMLVGLLNQPDGLSVQEEMASLRPGDIYVEDQMVPEQLLATLDTAPQKSTLPNSPAVYMDYDEDAWIDTLFPETL